MARISEEHLLRLLEEDGRMAAVKLAKELGVTETAVRKKMRKLEEKGVIKQYTTVIDPRKVGFAVEACIGIDTTPESYMTLIGYLKKQQSVKLAYTASGDHMIMTHCWFTNTEDMSEFIQKLEQHDGVSRTCPAVIVDRFK
jgi:Lrp/AsnC family transcriptional regulator for asnA, asnC and gidA